MKKTFNKKAVLTGVVLIIGIVLSSCKKGDTGPVGPAGANGTNGVSNITTYVGTTTNASWTLSGTEYDAIFNVSGITSSVVSNGSVMVFLGNTAQTTWSALPFSYQSVEFNYFYSLGQVTISVTLNSGSAPSNPGGIPFKIVVIPPAMIKQGVNTKNYSEVKAVYNLKD